MKAILNVEYNYQADEIIKALDTIGVAASYEIKGKVSVDGLYRKVTLDYDTSKYKQIGAITSKYNKLTFIHPI